MQVFDEYEYVCKQNDSFESISKQFFMSENYAKALQRYNQNHARTSDQMQKTGKLTAGEKIFIPQTGILEQRYADAIPKPSSPAAPPIPPPSVVPASATSTPPSPNP